MNRKGLVCHSQQQTRQSGSPRAPLNSQWCCRFTDSKEVWTLLNFVDFPRTDFFLKKMYLTFFNDDFSNFFFWTCETNRYVVLSIK